MPHRRCPLRYRGPLYPGGGAYPGGPVPGGGSGEPDVYPEQRPVRGAGGDGGKLPDEDPSVGDSELRLYGGGLHQNGPLRARGLCGRLRSLQRRAHLRLRGPGHPHGGPRAAGVRFHLPGRKRQGGRRGPSAGPGLHGTGLRGRRGRPDLPGGFGRRVYADGL